MTVAIVVAIIASCGCCYGPNGGVTSFIGLFILF